MIIGRSEIPCSECECDTVVVDDEIGLYLECTVCAWAVPMVVAPGDRPDRTPRAVDPDDVRLLAKLLDALRHHGKYE